MVVVVVVMIVEVVGVAVAVLVSDDTFGCDITNVVGASVGVVVGGRKVKVHVVEAVALAVFAEMAMMVEEGVVKYGRS